MPSDEKVVPWEDHYVIGQGFVAPANVPVKGYATAFADVPLGTDLDQATPGSDKIAKTILTNNEFEWTVAESYKDMATAIAASASFGVKGLGYSGSGSVEASSRTSVTQQSVVGILSTRFETHSFMLKKLPNLSKAALDVIATQGAEGFYQVFGTDFIAGQRLGGSFMGIIDVRLTSAQAKTAFAAEVKAEYKFAANKGSGAAAFKAAIEKSQGRKDVKVKWVAKGWDAKAQETFGGSDDPDIILTAGQKFAHNNSGVPVAAILRPFTSHPQFVDAVFRREGPALSLPPTVKDTIIRKIQLEAIRVNILSATLSEFTAAPKLQEDQSQQYKHQLEASRFTMARLEADPQRLNDLAIYMEHRPYNDNLDDALSEDDDVPTSLLLEERYQIKLQLQQAKSRLLAAQTLSSIKNKQMPAAATELSKDLKVADQSNGEPKSDPFREQYIEAQALADASNQVKALEAALTETVPNEKEENPGKNALGFVDSYLQGRSLYKSAFVSGSLGQKILALTSSYEAPLSEVIEGLTKTRAFSIQSYAFGTMWDCIGNGFVGDDSYVQGALKFDRDDKGQLWSIVPSAVPGEVSIALTADVGPWGQPNADPFVRNSIRAYLRMERAANGGLRVTLAPSITPNEIWTIQVLQEPAGCVAFKNKALGYFAAMPPRPISGDYRLAAYSQDIGGWEPMILNFVG